MATADPLTGLAPHERVPGRGRVRAARPLYEWRGDRSPGSRLDPVPIGPRSGMIAGV
jgi:hypothetical protein